MATMEDHSYLKICAELASCLSISIAAARRKVSLAAIESGVKDPQGRKAIAERLLAEAKSLNQGDQTSAEQFDQLLEALAEEENFMLED